MHSSVRSRGRATTVAGLVALTALALPAGADAEAGAEIDLLKQPPLTAVVTATPLNTFDPPTVFIKKHGTVTWKNAGGFHNVVFEDGSFKQPATADPTFWTVSRTFSTAGTFRYYCEPHRSQGMVGEVVVGNL